MKRIETLLADDFTQTFDAQTSKRAVAALEMGQVILLPQLRFHLLPTETKFLTPDAVNKKAKNISFNARTNSLQGDQYQQEDHEQLRQMLARFYEQSTTLIHHLLPQYAPHLEKARTSYRPVQAATREELSKRKDDRRLHVDAFPSTPNQGRRILRVFSNINPWQQSRIWRLGDSFENVARHFLPQLKRPLPLMNYLLKNLRLTKSLRTEYDALMLQLHDQMKKDDHYQREVFQEEVPLPAGGSWIVYTDQVSHAAMSGQFCLEQTFYLPVHGMVDPQKSPLHVLQKLTGNRLVK